MPSRSTAPRSSPEPPTRRSSRRSSRILPGSHQSPDALTRALRRWYLSHRRALPWRGTRDPWAVLVSEVMLQQTTVAVGLERYPRFLARFPTLGAMAAAREKDVLAAWAGLGYYARARNLARAARALAARGGFPRTAAELRALPGVGPYIAAAVASIAFGEPAAAVDANGARVVARLFAIAGDVRSAAVRARIEDAATRLLDRAHPGDHNQALMDLGAAVCTARRALCAECPLAGACRAREAGRPERFGIAPRKALPRRIALAAAVGFSRGRLLLVEDEELVRGHLAPPLCRVRDGEAPEEALARAFPMARVGRALGTLRHSVLDRRYTVHAFAVRGRKPENAVAAAREEIAALPHGGLLRKLLPLVEWPS